MPKVRGRGYLAVLLLSGLCICASAQSTPNTVASASIPSDRQKQYSDLAVQWEREYLQVNTTNPPGNEARAAAFFKKLLDQEGIENEVFEYAPGRADLWP